MTLVQATGATCGSAVCSAVRRVLLARRGAAEHRAHARARVGGEGAARVGPPARRDLRSASALQRRLSRSACLRAAERRSADPVARIGTTIGRACSRSATACARPASAQQLELRRARAGDQDPRAATCARSRRRASTRCPAPDLRQGLPAHLRGLPRARRAALRGRVQLALRRRRGGAARAGRARDARRTSRSAAPARSSGAGLRSRSSAIAASSRSSSPPGSSAAAADEQIPNLGTTTTTPAKKAPAAKPTAQPQRSRSVPALRARGRRQLAGWTCATGRTSGKSRFTGTLEPGQSQRFVARTALGQLRQPGEPARCA